MTTITRTFTVKADPQTVIDYLKDFSHAVEWDPGTKSCTANGDGPIEIGSSWHNVSKIFGVSTELTYTLERLTSRHVAFRGVNKTATSTDMITVTPDGGGARVEYHADIVMNGAAKLATPAIKLVFEKVGNDTQRQLTEVLNRLA